jgi:uncharacterized coiled-coil protein SlyX
MSNSDLNKKIETLEIRLMHLEAALDEVTRTLLEQENRLTRQADMIKQLEALVKGLADAGTRDARQDPPPPHY